MDPICMEDDDMVEDGDTRAPPLSPLPMREEDARAMVLLLPPLVIRDDDEAVDTCPAQQ
jgi:hypothetical protein